MRIQEKKINVILITLDSLRPDHLGCYGYARDTSPNIDTIANEGALFLNAVSQSSDTPGSLPSILTSNYPPDHGVYDFGDKISDKLITLPYLLKSRGYQTAFISSYACLGAIRGFEEQFDFYFTLWTYSINAEDTIKNIKKVVEINDRVKRWLVKNKRQKFFLWIHYLEPHFPVNPPSSYREMFMKDGLNKKELPVPISTHRGLGTGGIPSLLVASNNNITDLNYYIALYDGSIRYADDCIGELIKTLKELKLENKTMVIISSDHGEGLGEHGLYFTHGSQLYDELIKVPLIIKYKAITPNPKKIVTQVRHIDIAPTILDFLHIKKPASMKGDSLKNIIFKKSLLFPEFAFSQWRDRVSLRTEGWKLIYYGKKNNYELYNLKIDPGELINLIDVEKDKFQYFKKILSSYKIIYEPNRRDSKENLTEDMQERLRSLGYAQ